MSVFIVEGWSDDEQLRKVFPEIKTIVTNGTKFNNRIRDIINTHLENGEEIYVLSDPDAAGEQLYSMIKLNYPTIPRIPVDPEQASYIRGVKKKYGVEHCSYGYLRRLLYEYIY